MKRLIITPRGYVTKVNNFFRFERPFGYSSVLLCDWPFVFGCIPIPDVDENIIIDSFNWSTKNGYIEEDAMIHAAMYAYGFGEKKSIKDSILFPSCIPNLIDFPNKTIFNLSNDNFLKKFADNASTFSFPSAAKYIDSVYPIVDSIELLHQMFDAGAKIIQLRLKEYHIGDLDKLIKRACVLSLKYPSSKLFINDHWNLAIQNGAYGIHLGQDDLFLADMKAIENSGLHLGLSSHSYWEVSRAIRYKPSYIACGPIFPTKIKKMPWRIQGVQNLKYWSRVLKIPTVGIGGISLSNLHEVKKTSCSGISIISAIVQSKHPRKTFNLFESQWKKHRHEHIG